MEKTAVKELTTYTESVREAFDAIGADRILAEQSHILIKPNLVNDSPYPVTTNPACCEAVIIYLKDISGADIVIGEGCGDKDLETTDIFRTLGYASLAERHGVRLEDLNHAPLKRLENPDCPVFPEFYMPEIALTHFIISLPVLKAHSLAVITGTMKNMIGLAPPKHYSGKFGIWKKAAFHGNMHQAIIDLNRYRSPDLTLIDGGIGMPEHHLGGSLCDPPVSRLIAGFDPVAVDRKAAELLGIDWRNVPHLL